MSLDAARVGACATAAFMTIRGRPMETDESVCGTTLPANSEFQHTVSSFTRAGSAENRGDREGRGGQTYRHSVKALQEEGVPEWQ